MSPESNRDTVTTTGRPVDLEPTAPGFWAAVAGSVVAVLAPLFGFLIGSSMDSGDTSEAASPLYLGLFIGVVIGGCGVAVAVFGALRLYRNSRG